ncbi:MAG: HAD-IIIA family hydrolase [Parvibaculales bacterium]
MMSYPYAFLFDLDGTLAETAPDLVGAMNHVLHQHNIDPVPTTHVRDMIGGGARVILERGLAFNHIKWDDEKLDTATEELVAYYYDHIADASHLFDGVQDCLQTIQQAGFGCAVVTNKRYGLAEKLLTALQIDGYFQTLIGGDSLPTRKPEPDMLQQAATDLDTPIANCLMIGDSEADTKAAQAAGMACLCVDFGYSRTPVTELGAQAIISHYDEFWPAAKRCLPALKTQINL